MKINDREFQEINGFMIINSFQFLASTEYGVVLFDTSMVFDESTFDTSQDAIDYIDQELNS